MVRRREEQMLYKVVLPGRLAGHAASSAPLRAVGVSGYSLYVSEVGYRYDDVLLVEGVLGDEDRELAAHILCDVVPKLAKELNLSKGFRIVTNVGDEGGQTVMHLHFHLLGGRSMQWPPG